MPLVPLSDCSFGVFMPPANRPQSYYYCCNEAEAALWEKRQDCVIASIQQLLPSSPSSKPSEAAPSSLIEPSFDRVVVETIIGTLQQSALQTCTNIRTMKPSLVNELLAAVMPPAWKGVPVPIPSSPSGFPVTADWSKRLWGYLSSLDSLQPLVNGWPVLPTQSLSSSGERVLLLQPLSNNTTVLSSQVRYGGDHDELLAKVCTRCPLCLPA